MRLLVLLILVACGPTSGATFLGDAIRLKPNFDAIVQLQADALGDAEWPAMLHQLDITVHMQENIFKCGTRDAFGCTDFIGSSVYGIKISKYQGDSEHYDRIDMEEATLAHELLHIYSRVVLGDETGDNDHARTEIWRTVSFVFGHLPK